MDRPPEEQVGFRVNLQTSIEEEAPAVSAEGSIVSLALTVKKLPEPMSRGCGFSLLSQMRVGCHVSLLNYSSTEQEKK